MLYVGGSWLKKKQTTVTSASPTDQQMKSMHQNQFPSHQLPAEEGGRGRGGGGNHSFQPQPILIQKVVQRAPFDLLKYTSTKKAHNRKEGTPSFRRRHKMYKQTNNSRERKEKSKNMKKQEKHTKFHEISKYFDLTRKIFDAIKCSTKTSTISLLFLRNATCPQEKPTTQFGRTSFF